MIRRTAKVHSNKTKMNHEMKGSIRIKMELDKCLYELRVSESEKSAMNLHMNALGEKISWLEGENRRLMSEINVYALEKEVMDDQMCDLESDVERLESENNRLKEDISRGGV